MIATRAMGADTATVIAKRNSGDVTGRRTGYIVGYLSAVFSQSGDQHKTATQTKKKTAREHETAPDQRKKRGLQETHFLSPMERDFLRTVVRRSLEHAVKGASLTCPDSPTQKLQEKCGAFVTLKRGGQLRGCIGYIRPYKPLTDAVWEMAESAALRDARFMPVEPSEVDDIEIEITVLSPLQRIENPDDVLVGRHGLLISKGSRSGVLLPQVPVEADWDRETFLAQTCIKAGLPSDSWRNPGTTLEIFTAEVF
jgi:AmmeMemoRadiSam system protein A